MKTLLVTCFTLLCVAAFSPDVARSQPNGESPGVLVNSPEQLKPPIQLGQFLNGRVLDVASGETFTMNTPGNRTIEVWLAEIEAPEKGQLYWNASKQVLLEKLLGNDVTIQVVSIKDLEDGYDYVIAQVYLGNRWINREMVAEGWAWHFPQYFQSRELALADQQAREKNLGLWAVANSGTPWEHQNPAQVMPEEDKLQPWLRMAW